jgi:hypothetical protein
MSILEKSISVLLVQKSENQHKNHQKNPNKKNQHVLLVQSQKPACSISSKPKTSNGITTTSIHKTYKHYA